MHSTSQTLSHPNPPRDSPPGRCHWKLSRTVHFIMPISFENSSGAPEKAQSEFELLCRYTAEFSSQHLFLPFLPHHTPSLSMPIPSGHPVSPWCPGGGSRLLGGCSFQLSATCLEGFPASSLPHSFLLYSRGEGFLKHTHWGGHLAPVVTTCAYSETRLRADVSTEQSFSWTDCHLLLEEQALLPNGIDFSVLCSKERCVRA